MSPDHLRGGHPTATWGRWSLAVVAYEALAGALPFPPLTTAAGREALLSGRIRPMSRASGAADAVWDAVFAQLLSSDATRRPQSAREIVSLLAEATRSADASPTLAD